MLWLNLATLLSSPCWSILKWRSITASSCLSDMLSQPLAGRWLERTDLSLSLWWRAEDPYPGSLSVQPQGSQGLITKLAHSCDPQVHHNWVDWTQVRRRLDVLDCMLKFGQQSQFNRQIISSLATNGTFSIIAIDNQEHLLPLWASF